MLNSVPTLCLSKTPVLLPLLHTRLLNYNSMLHLVLVEVRSLLHPGRQSHTDLNGVSASSGCGDLPSLLHLNLPQLLCVTMGDFTVNSLCDSLIH